MASIKGRKSSRIAKTSKKWACAVDVLDKVNIHAKVKRTVTITGLSSGTGLSEIFTRYSRIH